MNISRLKTFLTLADCLNFSVAAERLYCTQPTVSMQIKQLENEVGCCLLDRLGKKIYLNQKGELFKTYAIQIIELWQAAQNQVLAVNNGEQGKLAFGASNFVGIYLLPMLLNTFRQKFPQIQINMQIRSSSSLIQQLENNDIELLILSDKIQFDQHLYYAKTFYHDELTLVVPVNHPLAVHPQPTFSMLKDYTLLWKPAHSATRNFLEQTFKNHCVQITNYIEISSLEAIKQCVIHSLGIAFISRFAVQQEINNGLLKEIILPDLQVLRGINYVVRKDKVLSIVTKHFIRLLDRIAQKKDFSLAIESWQID